MDSTLELRTTCCFAKLWCKGKEEKWNVELVDSLHIDDLIWLKSKEEQRYAVIAHLLSRGNKRFKLVKISNGNTLLMCYPIEITEVNVGEVYQNKQSLFSCISKKLLSRCKLRLAHSAWTLLYDMDFTVVDHDLVNENDKSILIAKSMVQVSKRLNIHIIILPLGASIDRTIVNVLASMGYEQPITDFTMQLGIRKEWTTFDQYVDALKKKYHKRAVGIRAKGAELVYRVLDNEEIVIRQQELYALYQQVIDKQKFLYAKADPDHFSNLKQIYKDDFIVEGVYKNGRMVAFLSYFRMKGGIHVHFIGLDYIENEVSDLYFNLLFRGVELGISTHSTHVDFGRTSLDAKASLGALPEYQNIFVKAGDMYSNIKGTISGYLASLENNQWKVRQPFKE